VLTPAAVPALAIAVGAAIGSLLSHRACGIAAVLMLAATAAAIAAFARGSRAALVLTAAIGFGSAALALSAHQADRALRSTLSALHREQLAARDAPVAVEGRLSADAAPSLYGASLTIDVDRVETPGGWREVRGGVRLSVGGSLVARQLATEPHGSTRISLYPWASVAAWRRGRRVRAVAMLRVPVTHRNPGARDEAVALARRGIALVGSVKSAALVEVLARGAALDELAAAARARIRAVVERHVGPLGPASAAIVTAILIGDRAGLTEDVERRLQEAGTYHVVAISGGNIAVLAAVALWMLGLARAPSRAAAALTILLLWAYGVVASGGPSVERATRCAALYLAARALDHRAPAANALAVVAGLALVASPLDVFDPGLALSYGATLALIVGLDKSARRLFRWRLALAALGLAAATACAEIAVLPIAALAFGRVTVAGFLLNFAAIPLMTVVQVAGLAIVAADAILPPLGTAAAWVADLSVRALVGSTALLDVLPWLTWRVARPPLTLVAAYYAAWILCLRARRRMRRVGLAAALSAGALIAAPVPISPWPPRPAPDRLTVTVLDVGQGDATVVQLPDGRAVLVDAGGTPGATFDVGGRVVAPALVALGAGRLHALAVTHPDPDHIGGAAAVLRDCAPVEVWEGVPVPPHPARRALAALAAARQVGWRRLRAGDVLRYGAAEIRVLHPPAPAWERQRARNDDSLVLDVRLGRVSILLTGDIGAETERLVARALRPAAVRVLKAAHHGSATSTSAELLRAAKPDVVIFSAGRDNRYGHPAAAVVQRVRASGAQIFRTDEDGAVSVETDGKTTTIRTLVGSRQ
jgi:competence protein ComEC